MESYKHTIFYNPEPVVKYLDEFKKEVQERYYDLFLEVKYKNGSNTREPSDQPLEWILERCKKARDIRIMHMFKNFSYEKEKLEIVFMYDWYFAIFDLDLKHKDYFIEKYKLVRLP